MSQQMFQIYEHGHLQPFSLSQDCDSQDWRKPGSIFLWIFLVLKFLLPSSSGSFGLLRLGRGCMERSDAEGSPGDPWVLVNMCVGRNPSISYHGEVSSYWPQGFEIMWHGRHLAQDRGRGCGWVHDILIPVHIQLFENGILSKSTLKTAAT